MFSVFCLLSSVVYAEEAPRKITLTDGVRLILKPDAATDNVAVTLFVRMEPDFSATEDTVGEIVARAFLYGNENSSFDSIADTVQRVSGELEIRRTPDYVIVTFVTVSSRLKDAANLIGQALKNANFGPEALDRARKQIAEERRKREENAAANGLAAACAPFRPYPEPDAYALQRVGTEAAHDYFHRRYLPERTVIAVVGNFEPQQAESTFDNNLFDFDRRSTAPFRLRPNALSEGETPPQTRTVPGRAAYALISVPAPALGSPDYPAFLVLHTLLGVGHASRLFHRIRDAQGIGYDVNALYQPVQTEAWTAYLQWDGKRGSLTPADALRQLNTVIDSVKTEPPTDAELARARALAIGTYTARHERPREEALLLGWYETMGVGIAFDAELPKRLAAVQHDDVLRVLKTYFTQRIRVVVRGSQRE